MRQTKAFILVVVGVILLSSCNQTSTNKTKNKDGEVNNGIIPFSGHWIDKNYYTRLLKNKSPRDIQDNTLYLILPADTSKRAMVIFNFHEGSPDVRIVKKGSEFFIELNTGESEKNSNQKIIQKSKNEIIIGSKSFIKINPLVPQDEDPYILEELLFNGKYKTKDGKFICFTREGAVSGLEKYKYYKPIIDYYDEGMEVNQIILKENKSQRGNNIFGFQFKNDTLIIYNLIKSGSDSLNDYQPTRFGSPLFKLIKQKE